MKFGVPESGREGVQEVKFWFSDAQQVKFWVLNGAQEVKFGCPGGKIWVPRVSAQKVKFW